MARAAIIESNPVPALTVWYQVIQISAATKIKLSYAYIFIYECRVPDIEDMARFGDGFLNGLAKCLVSGGVIKHVQIRCRGKEGLVEILVEALVIVFNDYPFRVTC